MSRYAQSYPEDWSHRLQCLAGSADDVRKAAAEAGTPRMRVIVPAPCEVCGELVTIHDTRVDQDGGVFHARCVFASWPYPQDLPDTWEEAEGLR